MFLVFLGLHLDDRLDFLTVLKTEVVVSVVSFFESAICLHHVGELIFFRALVLEVADLADAGHQKSDQLDNAAFERRRHLCVFDLAVPAVNELLNLEKLCVQVVPVKRQVIVGVFGLVSDSMTRGRGQGGRIINDDSRHQEIGIRSDGSFDA